MALVDEKRRKMVVHFSKLAEGYRKTIELATFLMFNVL